MKYVGEYREASVVKVLGETIRKEATGEYSFMEVCGGHTSAIHRFGIPSLLPENVRLLSGPGCPVYVTSISYIDRLVGLSSEQDVIIACFGDLIRVPGSSSSLEKEKTRGADIRIVFSALDAVEIARNNKSKKIIFPGIGFETTAPGTAAAIISAYNSGIDNFFVLSAHKIMPPAIDSLIVNGTAVNGFICPGHVATITGADSFSFISDKYKLGCVISGFEPADIMLSVLMLVRQINSGRFRTEIQYSRAVTPQGNLKAKAILEEVFSLSDTEWRGLGLIKSSGLKIREKYASFDADSVFNSAPEITEVRENALCLCGEVLRGNKIPPDCRLFAKSCTPENPVGACMVSAEGACNAFFRYRRNG